MLNVRGIVAVIVVGVGGGMMLGAGQPTTGPAMAPAVAATQAGGFLTDDELVAAFRAGEYTRVLLETARIRSSAVGLQGHDEFKVLVLRAEAFLQVKSGVSAVETFAAAARMAPDEGKRAVLQVTGLLIRNSPGLKYAARTTDEEGNAWPRPGEKHGGVLGAVLIDLRDMSKRSAAIRAFYSDQWFATSAEIEKVKGASGVAGFHNALEALDELAAAEMAVAGRQEATQGLREKTAGEMDGAVRGTLAEMMKKVEGLDAAAKKLVPSTTVLPSGGSMAVAGSPRQTAVYQRLRGLSGVEAQELEETRTTARQAKPVLDLEATRLHVPKGVFEKSEADAAALEKRVGEVLSGNLVYAGTTVIEWSH